MLARRLRRRANIEPTLGKRLVFAGIYIYIYIYIYMSRYCFLALYRGIVRPQTFVISFPANKGKQH